MDFKELAQQMTDLHEKKNKDYGNSFQKTCDKYGLISALTRLNDKMNRIESLFNNNNLEVSGEFKDTLMDLAAYSLMTIEWMDIVDERNNRKTSNPSC